MITFRIADEADVLQYLKWANDKDVRNNATNTKIIDEVEHTIWFLNKLEDKNVLMLIFSENNIPKGQFRIDIIKETQTGVIDYSIDKIYRGKGLGTHILLEGFKYFSKLYPLFFLTGMVKKSNPASIKAFLNAGYLIQDEKINIKGEEYIKFSKNE